MRKYAKIFTGTILFLSLFFVNFNITKAQSTVLQKGTLLSHGVTYDVDISDKSNFIFINDDSIFDKDKKLNSKDNNTLWFPEGLIKVNRAKLIEIKRKLYNQNKDEVRISLSIGVKENKLIGLNYTLPKSSLITKVQFKSFDLQIKENLVFELISNNYTKNKNLTDGLIHQSF